MALKKSELYSSLWSSCDELRGRMDASQCKHYVLVMLFVKYVSDKYAVVPFAPITIPQGASFKDMVALKGKPSIGDDINKKIIGPLAAANRLSDMPDFNDATKLGTGKEVVDRLTNLVASFENKALDFSKNRADGDDILGDAKTTAATAVYDPTCGPGSLLLKVADEAETPVTLEGQEKDAATSGLAHMNMILHNNPTAVIAQGNTLADPRFKEGDTLKTYDYVAKLPFSDKRWSNGVDPLNDLCARFPVALGVPRRGSVSEFAGSQLRRQLHGVERRHSTVARPSDGRWPTRPSIYCRRAPRISISALRRWMCV
jgi:type I restriction enzyme M protein